MSQNKKTKTKSHFELDLDTISSHLGFAAMTAAAVLSLVELEHFRTLKVETFQPAYANVNSSPVDPAEMNKSEELIRRGEKEESPHSLVSYGTTMRSHATAGRR